MDAAKRLAAVVVQPKKAHTASLIFFHGSGDTANGIQKWIHSVLGRALSFSHIKIIFPSAPLRPYSIYDGQLSTVWYDRVKFSPDVPEHLESLDVMCQQVGSLVDEEVTKGIPKNRIIIGGISMGGSLALHLGYRFHQDVAGIFALSSFLNEKSAVYEAIKSTSLPTLPPLFACHGEADPLVLYDWGKNSIDNLLAAGIPVEFHSFPNLAHEMMLAELDLLQEWIQKKLPDK